MSTSIKGIKKNSAYYVVLYANGTEGRLSLLNDHVFRYHVDPTGYFREYPEPHDESHLARITAKSMEEYGTCEFVKSTLTGSEGKLMIETSKIIIGFEESSGLMSVTSKGEGREVLKEMEPLSIGDKMAKQTLKQAEDEYFFGGGTQNGRFSHKGEIILIINSNKWADGGVASPNPFYWSTNGYGVLRNTWTPGTYDFKTTQNKLVETIHKSNDFDAFYFVNSKPVDILKDYYELTGRPVLIPEYAFYQTHFNAYNRDYWVEASASDTTESRAIKFEDGKFYKEFLPKDIGNSKGVLESLNGEKENYQFSARAVIDRYKVNDMPLGWFIPNDGYGAGYGQTESLYGDIVNLKEFVDYCDVNGVKVGLWTESNLHPKDIRIPLKGERDLSNEIVKAGIVALKTDVIWVGSGYSFGLNGIEDAATIFVDRTKGTVRPMIITVDGWAGTQRHSAVWTGDQTGGNWENIRFHIPTVIGTSLSGQPNVGADIDGIFGGRSKEVNVREFQWKAFLPIQMNMDGWGWNPKTPFSFDTEATDINRAYLKLKSCLMPYNYSIGFEAVNGLPMIRSMALEFPLEKSAFTKDSQYQYMWGPSLLIAPIYNGDNDSSGNSIRNGLYLPGCGQIWVDFLTGEKYQGGQIINNLQVPLWKLPILVRDGAIIPTTNPNNNPGEINREHRIFNLYPNGTTEFTLYEDDGVSAEYLHRKYALTTVKCSGPKSNEVGNLSITVSKAEGSFSGFNPSRYTRFNVMASDVPESVTAALGGNNIILKKVDSKKEFNGSQNVYFFDEHFTVSKHLNLATQGKLKQRFLLIKIEKINTSISDVELKITGYINNGKVFFSNNSIDERLQTPERVDISQSDSTANSLTLNWSKVENAESYDVERDAVVFRNVPGEAVTFSDFSHLTAHKFRVRSVSNAGVSQWSGVVVGTTEDDPFKNVIEDVRTICNFPDQSCEELDNLTSNNNSIWHTHWEEGRADPDNDIFITLKFDLGDVQKLEKIEYLPRGDAGNGTILGLQYRISKDNNDWTDYSETITWDQDSRTKIIPVQQEARYVEFEILNSVGNFGSGTKMLFYKQADNVH